VLLIKARGIGLYYRCWSFYTLILPLLIVLYACITAVDLSIRLYYRCWSFYTLVLPLLIFLYACITAVDLSISLYYRCWSFYKLVLPLRSALLWDITQRRVVILYRRVGTTYRSHLKGSRSPFFSSWTSWPLKMGPICCPETSIKDYRATLRNIPEELRSQHRSGSLKSRTVPPLSIFL
jgi:hypothetical protein